MPKSRSLPMPHAVHNERAKLLANALDRASTGAFVTGMFVPAASAMLGHQIMVDGDAFATSIGLWSLCGVILHIEAWRVISTVRD